MHVPEKNIENWLEKLQRESWNLELLISGFSIFLLIQAMDGLSILQESYRNDFQTSDSLSILPVLFISIIALASFILVFNLVIHILLRGFWIGAIGLRSVQEKVDFDKLKYSSFFTEKLKTRIGSLDDLLVRLDTISSVVYSFTFLIIFMILSLFLWIIWVVLLGFLFNQLEHLLGESLSDLVSLTSMVVIGLTLLLGIIYLIDTLSLGFFKKYQWLSKIYYPIYWLFGLMTLSGIYRGIYYNLISRFSKNHIRIFLGTYLVLIFMFPFIKLDDYQFYPDTPDETELSSTFYDDLRKPDDRIAKASIPSQLVKNRFLPLFIRYNVNFNSDILNFCEGYVPSKTSTFASGIKIHSKGIAINDPKVKEADPVKLRACLENYYSIYLNDSLYTGQEFFYYTHPNKKEKGLYTVLDLANFSEGKNSLKVTTKTIDEEETLEEENYAVIPFWIER